jgi:hypothetical protein
VVARPAGASEHQEGNPTLNALAAFLTRGLVVKAITITIHIVFH